MMRLERGSSRLYGVMLMLAAVVLLADQLTKLWAVSALSDSERLAVIPPLIHFRLLYNAGAAFSMGTEATWVFTLAAAGAVVGILYTARRLASAGWALVLGALLGGAVSHLGDRLILTPSARWTASNSAPVLPGDAGSAPGTAISSRTSCTNASAPATLPAHPAVRAAVLLVRRAQSSSPDPTTTRLTAATP